MKAMVLVAGVSRRLYPLTEHRPKCLLEVGDRTIFDHQMDAVRSVGIREVCLVLGYRREQIVEHARRHHPDLSFTHVVNHRFFETNTAWSLWEAGDEFLDRDFVYMNGDVLFQPELLRRVVEAPHPAALAVEAKPCGEEEVKVLVDAAGRVTRIGKDVEPGTSHGEFIGVGLFTAPFAAHFYQALDAVIHEGGQNAYFEAGLDRILGEHPVHMVDVTDLPCIEIDFPEDYEAARRKVLPRFRTD